MVKKIRLTDEEALALIEDDATERALVETRTPAEASASAAADDHD